MFLTLCFGMLYLNRRILNFFLTRANLLHSSSVVTSRIHCQRGSFKKYLQTDATKTGMKPPNILVYTGKKDSVRNFDIVKKSLQYSINNDRYIVYHLKHDDLQSIPWADNSQMLIIACEHLYHEAEKVFTNYLSKEGTVLSFSSSLEDTFVRRVRHTTSLNIGDVGWYSLRAVPLLLGQYSYADVISQMWKATPLYEDKERGELVLQLNSVEGTGKAVFSQIYCHRDPVDESVTSEEFMRFKQSNDIRLEILSNILSALGVDCSSPTTHQLTPAYLLCYQQDVHQRFIENVNPRLKENNLKSQKMTLKFSQTPPDSYENESGDALMVVTTEKVDGFHYFDTDSYWKSLKTRVLGNCVIYSDVIASTMPVLDGLMFSCPSDIGLIAVAGRQTRGRGRGGNDWLSPEGCAMFTIHVKINLDSELGQRASFLQHITSLAVVNSVRTLVGYDEIDLRLKWPNDIYFGRSMKIGGVIVQSTLLSNSIHALIGCGFNVSNSNPTICINDIIHQHNQQNGTHLRMLSTSELIARTVTCMEGIIDKFQTNGKEEFCKRYHELWLHSGSRVKVASERGREMTVVGLDDYGYLKVRDDDGKEIVLQPDGNSFDMMKNLITMKA